MEIEKIVGIVMLCIVLVALLILLYYVCFKTVNLDIEERKVRIKMFKVITSYLEKKQDE